MSVKERLTEFIRFKKISNSEFCRSIGVSTAFVTSMVKSIQPDKAERISLNYPELNLEWLLTGKGDMIKSSSQISPDGLVNIPQTVKERLVQFLKFKKLSQSRFETQVGLSNGYVNNIRKSISPERLQSITLYFPDLNTEWLLTGNGEMIKSSSQNSPDGFVHIPQAVFDVIQKQANSLERRDNQIDELISIIKKTNVLKDDNAKCADAIGM